MSYIYYYNGLLKLFYVRMCIILHVYLLTKSTSVLFKNQSDVCLNTLKSLKTINSRFYQLLTETYPIAGFRNSDNESSDIAL